MTRLPRGYELSHSGRIQRAVELGRQARTDPKIAATVRALLTGGFTHRLLAAYACHGSQNASDLAALCGDESRIVANTALKVLRSVGDRETILTVLRQLPPRKFSLFLYRIRADHSEVVDRFLRELGDAGNVAAWPLIPLGSPAIVDRYFATAAERGGDRFWSRLASPHPHRATEEIIARLDAASAPDGLLLANARAALAALSDPEPDLALAVVVSLHRHSSLISMPLDALIVRRPAQVADLILGATECPPFDFRATVHRLGVARLIALYRRNARCFGAPETWLAKLPAADRAGVYRELAPAWTTTEGLIAPGIDPRAPPCGSTCRQSSLKTLG